jgi:hypothetical protein
MMPAVVLVASGKLAPQQWVETLLAIDSAELDREPFGPLVLLVRAPDDDESGQFLEQLVASVLKEGVATGEHPRWPVTSQFPTVRIHDAEVSEADQIELLAELSSAPHCIVPLRPTKPGVGHLVGRSPHSEVYMSDPSVSAEHARLYVDDGGVRIFDLESKNGTMLNGGRLPTGESPWLQPMDRLTFGRVQAFACDPRVLRSVLRHELRNLV